MANGAFVKIGRSKNAAKRLQQLQSSYPHTLQILAIISSDRELELHQRFSRYRTGGEWFLLSDEIRQFIAKETGQLYRKPFFVWLTEQISREDEIGRFAIVAVNDKQFPRGSKLSTILRHCGFHPKFRSLAKVAHRLWRQEHKVTPVVAA